MPQAVLQGALVKTLSHSALPSSKLLLHVQLPQRSCRLQRWWHRCETIVGQVQRREVPQPCSVLGRLGEAPQAIPIQPEPLHTMHTLHPTIARRLSFLQMPLTCLEPVIIYSSISSMPKQQVCWRQDALAHQQHTHAMLPSKLQSTLSSR